MSAPPDGPAVYHVLINGHCTEHTENFADVVLLIVARGGGGTFMATAPDRWNAIADNNDKIHVRKMPDAREDAWLAD